VLLRVDLRRTDVSEDHSASIIRVTRIGEIGTTIEVYIAFLRSVRRLLDTANVVPSSAILVTLKMEALRFSDSPILTIAKRHNIQEGGILQY
jgi:hypothetical protein